MIRLKIRNEIEDTTTSTLVMQRFVKHYYEQLYTNKLENLEEINKFLEAYTLPKLNHEEIEKLNRPIISKDTELVIKNLPKTESPGANGFMGKSTKHLRKNSHQTYSNFSKKLTKR